MFVYGVLAVAVVAQELLALIMVQQVATQFSILLTQLAVQVASIFLAVLVELVVLVLHQSGLLVKWATNLQIF
jgi:hypothetical protein